MPTVRRHFNCRFTQKAATAVERASGAFGSSSITLKVITSPACWIPLLIKVKLYSSHHIIVIMSNFAIAGTCENCSLNTITETKLCSSSSETSRTCWTNCGLLFENWFNDGPPSWPRRLRRPSCLSRPPSRWLLNGKRGRAVRGDGMMMES